MIGQKIHSGAGLNKPQTLLCVSNLLSSLSCLSLIINNKLYVTDCFNADIHMVLLLVSQDLCSTFWECELFLHAKSFEYVRHGSHVSMFFTLYAVVGVKCQLDHFPS